MATLKEILKDAYKDGMTLEEIEAALGDVTLPEDNSAEVERLKNALTKSNGEAADYKRQLRDKMSDEEKRAKEAQDAQIELQQKYEALLHENEVSKYTANYIALGYDEKLAAETAEALSTGDTAKVFENQRKHLTKVEQAARANALKETPKPTKDGDSTTMTKEKLRAMSPSDRYKYSVENPTEYRSLYVSETANES